MALRDLVDSYKAIGIGTLTAQEEQFVLRRIQGLNPSAAARAANYPNVHKAVIELTQREDIEQAIAYGRGMARAAAVNAGAIEFTKNDATALYLEAHAKAEDGATEIRAVDSLVKLHGLAAPEKKEISVTAATQLEQLDDEDLMRMAGRNIELSPENYKAIED